jgi:hypothetical protein
MEASSTYDATTNGHSQSPWDAHEAAAAEAGKPEIPVIAAFVGGFVLARILKALGGDDE